MMKTVRLSDIFLDKTSGKTRGETASIRQNENKSRNAEILKLYLNSLTQNQIAKKLSMKSQSSVSDALSIIEHGTGATIKKAQVSPFEGIL